MGWADGDAAKFSFLITFGIKSGKIKKYDPKNPNFKNSRHGFENVDFNLCQC